MRKYIAAVLLLASVSAAYAAVSAESVMSKVKASLAGVNDYSARASLRVDSPTVHIERSTFKVYYKKPNKLHIQPDGGFAIVPKGTYIGNPFEEITRNNNLKVTGTGKIDGRECWLVKLTPKVASSRSVESTLYIDKARGLILASRAKPAPDAKVNVDWDYTKVDGKYWLPSKIEVTIDGLPAEIARERGPFVQSSGKASGSAVIKFSDYRVNKGISDSVFRRNEEK